MNETREIPLTQGKVAIVDVADYDFLMQWKWHAHHNKRYDRWYAVRTVRHAGRGCRMVLMHRVLVDEPAGLQVDHRDGDGLNNRRSNLRPSTHSQNQYNRGATRNNKSGFKGVCWQKNNRKWQAQITVAGRQKYLGMFDDKRDAAAAYAKAAQELHGDFAKT